jgi:hypothetical protein
MKSPGQNLTIGGGGLTPILSYGDALAMAGSDKQKVTHAPLKSRLGTVVLNLRMLASSRAQGRR